MGANFEPTGDILYGGNGNEYYLDYILFSPVALIFPKWWTFKLVYWVQILN
jgi:hypothetical protein